MPLQDFTCGAGEDVPSP